MGKFPGWSLFVLGVFVGWLVEWLIDWFYWRSGRLSTRQTHGTEVYGTRSISGNHTRHVSETAHQPPVR